MKRSHRVVVSAIAGAAALSAAFWLFGSVIAQIVLPPQIVLLAVLLVSATVLVAGTAGYRRGS